MQCMVVSAFILIYYCVADSLRKSFVESLRGKLSLNRPKCVEVNRSTVFNDALAIYSTKPYLANQFPILVEFEGEDGVDFGGVGRDFFSAFWDEAYKRLFDGAALLTPVSHADIQIDDFTTLGKILSHGYFCYGFIPSRISFPVLAFVLLGPDVTICRSILLQSFSDFLTAVDRKVISDSLEAKQFTLDIKTGLINIISQFGCRDMPTPDNLPNVLITLAKHQFKSQPFAAISAMHNGIPEKHKPFWETITVEKLYALCNALSANPEKTLEKIQEPFFNNRNEQRVFMYLQQYIGEMKTDEVKRFLRFITGSSVLTNEDINISFNALTGIARRPIAHTCSSLLELPYTYNTYLEFVSEFSTLLNNEEHCWAMNSV